MNDILHWSALQISQAIKSREIKAEEIISVHLHHIETINPKLTLSLKHLRMKASRKPKKLIMLKYLKMLPIYLACL